MMEKSYSSLEDNYRAIQASIQEEALRYGRNPAEIRLMAVTKTVPPEAVNRAIALGINLLGENKAQELCQKYDDYQRETVSIHFIGHLQTNKVRQVVDKVDMIHSLDSVKLAKEIHRQAEKYGKVMDVLVEVNVGGEESKSGVTESRLSELCESLREFQHIRLRGLMCIPPLCANQADQERYFSRMGQLLVDIQDKNRDNKNIDILSMGMSGDFPLAIKHGASIIRIGTALFGARDYSA